MHLFDVTFAIDFLRKRLDTDVALERSKATVSSDRVTLQGARRREALATFLAFVTKTRSWRMKRLYLRRKF